MIEYYNGIALIAEDKCITNFIKEKGKLDFDDNMNPYVLPYIPVGGTVIDVGAFVGDSTKAYIDKVGEHGEVFALEPSKEAFKCLKYNMQDYENAICTNAGVGFENTVKSIVKVADNLGMNYLTDESFEDSIEVYSLDKYCKFQDIDKLDFIKIDCEGYELEVLKGATETINKFKPVMLIEINELTLQRNGIKPKDIYLFLDLLGYKYRNIYPNQTLDEYQMDIICEPIK